MFGFDGMHFGMGWGWLIGLIVVALIVWFIVRVTSQNTTHRSTSEKSPMDILKERYARGEINKEEFEERKKDLM
ncbi:MAG: SHOCT domain-containing protein [Bacteroidota bacterium]|nr:SHOCT domain-containing protein [Bacteroidota bacterium]